MKLFMKERKNFMDPKDAMADGLVAVNDAIDTDLLLEAYSFGIFPWPHDDYPVLWFCPSERGILNFNKYRPSKSLLKLLRKSPFEIKMNKNFQAVIENCQKAPRPDQEGTWITDAIFDAYLDFHRAGYAHSIEAWDGDELVGGMYGVYVAGVFCGESMFYKRPNASKVCLHQLVEFLRSQGHEWMDIQMVTPYMDSVGAEYLSRNQFLKRLEQQKKCARQLDIQAF